MPALDARGGHDGPRRATCGFARSFVPVHLSPRLLSLQPGEYRHSSRTEDGNLVIANKLEAEVGLLAQLAVQAVPPSLACPDE
jgi:hypothetical protein